MSKYVLFRKPASRYVQTNGFQRKGRIDYEYDYEHEKQSIPVSLYAFAYLFARID